LAKKSIALKNQKRNMIIEAAVHVFAEKGFFNANVHDVAQRAGIADGTIYVYFKSKDDLLISLFEQKMDGILDRFSKKLRTLSDPLDKLRTFISTYYQMIKEDKHLAEVFQVELRQSSKFLKDYHNQKFLDFLDMIASILQQGQQENFFRPELNIDIAKIMIFGAIDEVARQWILGAETKFSLEEACQQTSESLISGILNS